MAEAVPPLGLLLSGLPDRPVPAGGAAGFAAAGFGAAGSGATGFGSSGPGSSGPEADPRLWIDWGVGERFAQVEAAGGSEAAPPRLTDARILTHLGVPHALPADPRLVDALIARLCLRDGKTRYLDFMPRVWAAIARDVAHPALAPLAAALAGVPPPSPEIIERIRARCGTMPE